MKKALVFLSIIMASVSISFAQQGAMHINVDVIMGNRPPTPNEARLMHNEESLHPNITKAMHDLEDGMRHLHEAPNDFGGHKGQAETDMQQAWVSLRKALYFRLYEDRH
ncbi:MAG: hypothetical protein JST58_08995 [Bacteroidetes bacterium]|nr:hypothetical protein [Bacteroidota bacterium]